jgi:hypothetical protein
MTPHAMTHLTPEELIDSHERQLPPARQAHADACVVCRAKLAELDEVLLEVKAVGVPEPSPLFWDHLSARIRDRVAHEPPPAPARDNPLARLGAWFTGWSAAPRWAFAAVLLALCASLGWLGWSELLRRDGTGPAAPGLQRVQVDEGQGGAGAMKPAPADTAAPGATVAAGTSGAADDAESEWTLMLRMAEDVSWDDAEGSSLYVRPAAVDRALTELTAEERDRLLQLLRADLARQNQKS